MSNIPLILERCRKATLLFFCAWILAVPAFAAEQSPSGRGWEPPYSCRLLYDEQRKCAFGSCDKRVLERLNRECLRDGGRP